MAFLTVFVDFCAFYGNKLPDKVSRFFPYLFLFLTAAVFILANTVCRAKTTEKKEGESQEEKGNKRAVYGSWVFTGVILILVGFVLFTGNVKVKLTGSTMKIQGSYWKDYEVKLQDIKEISFREEFSGEQEALALAASDFWKAIFLMGNSEIISYMAIPDVTAMW